MNKKERNELISTLAQDYQQNKAFLNNMNDQDLKDYMGKMKEKKTIRYNGMN